MKKLVALLTALTLLPAAGCAGNNGSKGDTSQAEALSSEASQIKKASQLNYKETKIPLPEDSSNRLGFGYMDGLRLFYTNKDGENALQLYNEDTELSEVIMLEEGEDAKREYRHETVPCIMPDGGITLLYEYAVYDGDMSDYEAYLQKAEISFTLKRFSAEGKLLSEAEIDDFEEFFTFGDTFINGLYAYGDSYILSCKDSYVLIGADGKVVDMRRDGDFSSRYWFASCTDGSVIAAGEKGWSYMDGESLKIPDNTYEYGKWRNRTGPVFTGAGEYKAFLYLDDGIYGIGEDETLTKLMGFMESKMGAAIPVSVTYAGEGRFAMILMDQTTSAGVKFSLFTVRPDDYVENKTPLTVGCLDYDNNAPDTVTMFNSQSDDYIAQLKKYKDFDDLKLDVLSGNQPDICCYDESATMYRYANLGAFTDLYTLLDTKPELSRDDIVPNVMKAYEYKGGLYGLPVAFNVDFWVANREVISRDYSCWNYDEFFSFIENLPEGMYIGSRNSPFAYDNREIAWSGIFSVGSFVDFINYTCDFNNDRFIRLLEFCNSFEVNEAYDWSDGVFDGSDEQKMLEYWEANYAVKNKTALLQNGFTHNPDSLINQPHQFGLLEDDNYTYLIYPSDDRRGVISTGNYSCYSVLNNCSNPDGAWAYFCYIMSEDYQNNYMQVERQFTSNKASYEYKLNTAFEDTQDMLYFYEGGYGNPGKGMSISSDHEYFKRPITDETKQYLLDILASCDKLSGYDKAIYDIVEEEVSGFFAGEKTAQECAEMVQNRVSIYLSENS